MNTDSMCKRLFDYIVERGVILDCSLVPECERTAAGNASRTQTVSFKRIEWLVDHVGADVRRNAMTGDVEIKMAYRAVDGSIATYDSRGDESHAGRECLVHCALCCGMKAGDSVRDMLDLTATKTTYHPVENWIDSKDWDGIDRWPDMFATITLRDPSKEPWKRVAMRKWFKQTAIAMTNYKRPGGPISVPYVLGLQGPERRGKSKWVISLLPHPWVRDGMTLKLDSLSSERDSARRVTASMITELGELDATFKRTDHAGLKNFLSTTVDSYRNSYGRGETAKPRCTTFVATVNPENFLIGQEGESRFWFLAIEGCNWDHGIDMQQFWMQVAIEADEDANFELTDAEKAMHGIAVGQFAAPTDTNIIMDRLNALAGTAPKKHAATADGWAHKSPKAMMRDFDMPYRLATSIDLNSALSRAGYRSAKIEGTQGWWVPQYQGLMTEAQKKGFRIVRDDDAE